MFYTALYKEFARNLRPKGARANRSCVWDLRNDVKGEHFEWWRCEVIRVQRLGMSCGLRLKGHGNGALRHVSAGE